MIAIRGYAPAVGGELGRPAGMGGLWTSVAEATAAVPLIGPAWAAVQIAAAAAAAARTPDEPPAPPAPGAPGASGTPDAPALNLSAFDGCANRTQLAVYLADLVWEQRVKGLIVGLVVGAVGAFAVRAAIKSGAL